MAGQVLAFDRRTKPYVNRESGTNLQRARMALAKLQPWAVAQMMKIYRDPETTRGERIRILMDFMDRGGLPKRTDVDLVDDRFSAAEMREIFREVAREQLTNPQGGMVNAVDAEYTVQTNGNGHSAE